MWHNQTEQVMQPCNLQGWCRHWQGKCTPLIHRLWSCHWEWTIPRSCKGLRTHCANLSTPPCPSYVAQEKPPGSHSPMAACQACALQSNGNQHSRQLHWFLHWNHQLVNTPPKILNHANFCSNVIKQAFSSISGSFGWGIHYSQKQRCSPRTLEL